MESRERNEHEAREAAAKQWLERFTSIDDSAISPKQIDDFLEGMRKRNDIAAHKYVNKENAAATVAKLQTHPNLTLEEISRGPTEFGSTGNLVNFFRPSPYNKPIENGQTPIDGLRALLKYEILPEEHEQHEYLYFLLKDGQLMRAFHEIGYARSQALLEGMATRFAQSRKWRAQEDVTWHAMGEYTPWDMPDERVITDDERAKYIASYIEEINGMRHLFLALLKQNVNYNVLAGTGEF